MVQKAKPFNIGFNLQYKLNYNFRTKCVLMTVIDSFLSREYLRDKS